MNKLGSSKEAFWYEDEGIMFKERLFIILACLWFEKLDKLDKLEKLDKLDKLN